MRRLAEFRSVMLPSPGESPATGAGPGIGPRFFFYSAEPRKEARQVNWFYAIPGPDLQAAEISMNAVTGPFVQVPIWKNSRHSNQRKHQARREKVI